MKIAHKRGARWALRRSMNPQPQLVATLWEGTTDRPASADRLIERIRHQEWTAKRGKQ